MAYDEINLSLALGELFNDAANLRQCAGAPRLVNGVVMLDQRVWGRPSGTMRVIEDRVDAIKIMNEPTGTVSERKA